jgi:3-deoxy-D-manno-octulosonic-acid transferase
MQVILYNLFTRLYFTAIRLAAFFDEKARLWVAGRQGIFEKIKQGAASRLPGEKLVWMHCASLGEFEQGRTVLEGLKKQRPDIRILLTFFSPSGYEIRKNYEHADWVFYLPSDTAAHARRFIEIVKPDLAVFVKYEFWYHYLSTLKQLEIPTLLIAATFRPQQPFFRWYGSLHRRMLACFTHIFVQNHDSAQLLSGITRTPVEIAGDTRVDRVLEIAQQKKEFTILEKFCGDAPVLVCGSTWPEDEAVIFEAMQAEKFRNWKIVMAPHDVQPAHLQQIEKNAPSPVLRFSQAGNLPPEQLRKHKILLIDNVGMLAWLYRFGRVACVGGGFGVGIHNILEPIAHGIPVIFGPKYGKFEEARMLVKTGGGFSVRNAGNFEAVMQQLLEPADYQEASARAGDFIRQNQGATGKVFDFMLKLLG